MKAVPSEAQAHLKLVLIVRFSTSRWGSEYVTRGHLGRYKHDKTPALAIATTCWSKNAFVDPRQHLQ